MKKEKKIWFTGVSRNLWIPKSIEGWIATVVSMLAVYLIYTLNEVSGDVPFVFSQHWPILLELAVVIAILYLVSKDHVDKKY